MPAVRITSVEPSETIAMYEKLVKTLARLPVVRNSGAMIVITTTSAIRAPLTYAVWLAKKPFECHAVLPTLVNSLGATGLIWFMRTPARR